MSWKINLVLSQPPLEAPSGMPWHLRPADHSWGTCLTTSSNACAYALLELATVAKGAWGWTLLDAGVGVGWGRRLWWGCDLQASGRSRNTLCSSQSESILHNIWVDRLQKRFRGRHWNISLVVICVLVSGYWYRINAVWDFLQLKTHIVLFLSQQCCFVFVLKLTS